jgi:hypothetical protein
MTEPAANVEAELARIVAALRDLGRPYALVGGLAASIRGEVRFTRDVDLAIVSDSDASTERLVGDLTARGYRLAALVEHDSAGRLATARLRTRAGVNVDLLAASSGIEAEVIGAARDVDIEGVGPIPVVVEGQAQPIVHVAADGMARFGSADVKFSVGAAGELITTVANIVLP